MRKTLVATAVATVFSAGALLTGGANAITLTAPSGLRAATEGVTTPEQVRYVCYRNARGVRVCSYRRNYGYYGGSPYYGYGGYYPSYGYYGSPYYYGPSVGIGLGYGYGGYYGGWGGSRTVIHRRTVVRRGHR